MKRVTKYCKTDSAKWDYLCDCVYYCVCIDVGEKEKKE